MLKIHSPLGENRMKRKSITITTNTIAGTPLPLTWRCLGTALAALIISVNPGLAADGPSVGFAFDRFQLTLEEGYRTEAAGPFYYSQQSDSNSVWAVPPIFLSQDRPAVDAHGDNFLYPLFTYRRYGTERHWQFFQLISATSGLKANDADTKEFTLFPDLFPTALGGHELELHRRPSILRHDQKPAVPR